jgi:hypothetical protein
MPAGMPSAIRRRRQLFPISNYTLAISNFAGIGINQHFVTIPSQNFFHLPIDTTVRAPTATPSKKSMEIKSLTGHHSILP